MGSIRLHGYVPDRGLVDPMLRSRPNASPLNPSVTWETIERIAGLTSLPVLVKGVLRADDARAAIEHGCAGVVVSNHGERQLDGVVPTAVVLESIAPRSRRPGVGRRRDTNGPRRVARLCLGAHAVLIGRPYLWALAVAGEAGVGELLTRLQLELENALALTGCASPAEVDRSLVLRVPD